MASKTETQQRIMERAAKACQIPDSAIWTHRDWVWAAIGRILGSPDDTWLLNNGWEYSTKRHQYYHTCGVEGRGRRAPVPAPVPVPEETEEEKIARIVQAALAKGV